jgi:hypothetical protein
MVGTGSRNLRLMYRNVQGRTADKTNILLTQMDTGAIDMICLTEAGQKNKKRKKQTKKKKKALTLKHGRASASSNCRMQTGIEGSRFGFDLSGIQFSSQNSADTMKTWRLSQSKFKKHT